MYAIFIAAIAQGVVADFEEVPNSTHVIENAIAASKSGDGPAAKHIVAALK
ncbi:hypothetical protein [Asaia sp. HN010]|uniref:hypothetical protein n=1 Tax=Asaia sp. HN010 TaxID=3081233 RepID=UPI00301645BA